MQKLQLTIPEPCHENWQNMTPTDQGRFCNACAKEVVDFSMMTDTEVLNYFTAVTHEKVCGRVLPSQLERTIIKPKDPKKKLFWYWNYIVMFFMFFGKGNSAKAQRCGQATTEAQLNIIRSTNVNNALAGKVGKVAVDNNRIITGKVTDINGNPIAFASIKIKESNTGITADVNGVYSLKVKPNAMLIITAASFKETTVPVGLQSTVNTVMEKYTGFKEVIVFSKSICRTQNFKGDMQVHLVGQTIIAPVNTDSIYVIDGTMTTKAVANDLNPDDIADIIRLEKNRAAAIFGPEGSNGAVVITTRKSKEIKMNEVVVNSEYGTRRMMMGGMTGGITFTRQDSLLGETITTVKTILTDSIKVYPNPVNRNAGFSVQLKLKQPGNNYSMLITDAAGRVLLQQKFNATAKDHTEKITGDRRWAAGIYYIRIFDTQNKLISKSSFIFK